MAQQKRELSRELKNSVGNTDNLIRRVTELAAGATGADKEKYTTKLEALRGAQKQLGDQLDLVNKATTENSKGVFATAREVVASTNKSLEDYKSELGGSDTKEPATK